MKRRLKKLLLLASTASLALIAVGLLIPGGQDIPVQGASSSDWNEDSFWHYPWGASGVHKGIDLFAAAGTPVTSATPGLVVSTGSRPNGGNYVLVLGPKWRMHYYAHLESGLARGGQFVRKGDPIGTVGTSGNAEHKQPHLHYAVLTLIPYPWRVRNMPQGLRRMWYLNPSDRFSEPEDA